MRRFRARWLVGGALACALLATGWVAGLPSGVAAVPGAAPHRAPATAPVHVVGLGDSVPAGATLALPASYVDLVGESLAARDHAWPVIVNDAVGGFETQDVLEQLDDYSVQRDLAAADVVLVMVGANDLGEDEAVDPDARAATLAEVRPRLTSVYQRARDLAPHARVLAAGYWSVFLDGEVAEQEGQHYVDEVAALTRDFNEVAEKAAAAAGISYVDVAEPMHAQDVTELLNADGDHPNEAGHRIIAAAFLTALDATDR